MKIDHHADPAKTIARSAPAAPQARAAAPASASESASRSSAQATQAGVPVTLSENVRTAVGRGGADFNAEKVASVKTAISKGTYRVNAEAVADKLLENAAEVLGRARQQPSH